MQRGPVSARIRANLRMPHELFQQGGYLLKAGPLLRNARHALAVQLPEWPGHIALQLQALPFGDKNDDIGRMHPQEGLLPHDRLPKQDSKCVDISGRRQHCAASNFEVLRRRVRHRADGRYGRRPGARIQHAGHPEVHHFAHEALCRAGVGLEQDIVAGQVCVNQSMRMQVLAGLRHIQQHVTCLGQGIRGPTRCGTEVVECASVAQLLQHPDLDYVIRRACFYVAVSNRCGCVLDALTFRIFQNHLAAVCEAHSALVCGHDPRVFQHHRDARLPQQRFPVLVFLEPSDDLNRDGLSVPSPEEDMAEGAPADALRHADTVEDRDDRLHVQLLVGVVQQCGPGLELGQRRSQQCPQGAESPHQHAGGLEGTKEQLASCNGRQGAARPQPGLRRALKQLRLRDTIHRSAHAAHERDQQCQGTQG
mmetsp:Transcript_123249/g.356058  ORF Transcript_123249/g.356058 Transcript_123249/m.356058 type:complete len:422 (+) Transcript_123249:95-1360(+)